MKSKLSQIIIIIFITSIFHLLSSNFICAGEIKPVEGGIYSVPLKAKQTDEPKSSGISIFGIDIIKKSPCESFDVKINYTNYYFITADGLPGYYIGWPMSCEVEVTNKSENNFENLNITMVHEYYESGICDRYWCPPYPVEFNKGQQLPGDTGMVWPGVDILKGETVVLSFTYTCPYETCSGLDQTHVIIEDKKEDYILELYNESEAGVFCPPPPE